MFELHPLLGSPVLAQRHYRRRAGLLRLAGLVAAAVLLAVGVSLMPCQGESGTPARSQAGQGQSEGLAAALQARSARSIHEAD